MLMRVEMGKSCVEGQLCMTEVLAVVQGVYVDRQHHSCLLPSCLAWDIGPSCVTPQPGPPHPTLPPEILCPLLIFYNNLESTHFRPLLNEV